MSDHSNDRDTPERSESSRPARGSLRRRLGRLGRRIPRSSGALAGSPPGAGGRLLQL